MGTVKVWYVSPHDADNDPAFGMEPLFTGSEPEAVAWLGEQPTIDNLTVTLGPVESWTAADYLAHLGGS